MSVTASAVSAADITYLKNLRETLVKVKEEQEALNLRMKEVIFSSFQLGVAHSVDQARQLYMQRQEGDINERDTQCRPA